MTRQTSKQLETIAGDLMLAGVLVGAIGVIAITIGPMFIGWWAALAGTVTFAICALCIACSFRASVRARALAYVENENVIKLSDAAAKRAREQHYARMSHL